MQLSNTLQMFNDKKEKKQQQNLEFSMQLRRFDSTTNNKKMLHCGYDYRSMIKGQAIN